MVTFSVGITLACDYPGCDAVGACSSNTQTEAANVARSYGWAISRSGCADESETCRCPEHKSRRTKGARP